MSEIVDSFTDADNTLLVAHTPETGGPWVMYDFNSVSAGTPRIVGNRVRVVGSDAASPCLFFPAPAGGGDVDAEPSWVAVINFRFIPHEFSNQGLLSMWFAADTGFGYVDYDNVIFSINNLFDISFAGAPDYPYVFPPDTDHEVEVRYNNPTTEVYLNGVLIATTTTPSPVGKVAIEVVNFNGADVVGINSFSYTLGPPPPNPEFWTQFVKTAETV